MRLPEPPEWTPTITVFLTVLVLASPRVGGLMLGGALGLSLLYAAAAGLIRFSRWLFDL